MTTAAYYTVLFLGIAIGTAGTLLALIAERILRNFPVRLP